MAGFIQKKRCITLLQELGGELGRTVQCADVQNRTVLYRSILHHFGSFEKARRAAGLPELERERQWSREAVTKELRRLYEEGVRITNWDLFQHDRWDLIAAARTYCGGVARARALAGIPTPKRPKTDREPWDEERIVEEIRNLNETGESLAPTRISRKLMNAAVKYFGSYRAAVEAAGFDYDAVRLIRERYTREDLLRELPALAKTRPEMTLSEFGTHGMVEACLREFGSLEAAFLAAGLTRWPLRLSSKLLTEAETREALRARMLEGHPVSVSVLQREDLRLLRSAMRHFGGPIEAIEGAADENLVDEPRGRGPWTEEEIRERLRAREKAGLPINHAGLQREDPRLLRAICKKFGNLQKAAKHAGVAVEPLKSPWTTEALRNALQARRRAGLPMNPTAIYSEQQSLYKALKRRYGDFTRPEVATELGLPPDALAPLMTRWSPELVIAKLQALASGTEPVRWDQIQPVLRNTAIKYFGSMDAARAAAGVTESRQRWPRERVLELIRNHPPDKPWPQNLKNAGRQRFGSWLSALEAAGIPPRRK